MITKGSLIIAKVDHFDDYFGDIIIESGDKFVVEEATVGTLTLKPQNESKYSEPLVISHEEYFDEVK